VSEDDAAPQPQSKVSQYDLMYCIRESIFNNRLMFIATTSAAKGAIENEGFQFGQGKSHWALGVASALYQMAYNCSEEEAEEHVKLNIGYCKDDLVNMIKRGMNKRVVCYVADDMEVDFGKHKSHDNEFRELAYFCQTIRPQVAVIIGTMPDLGQIARAWRDLFLFEVKVPFRGYCEIQKLKRWSDFYDPLNPKVKLDYKGEQEFPPASPSLKAWYEPWRVSKQQERLDAWVKKYGEKPAKPEKPRLEFPEGHKLTPSDMGKLRWQKYWDEKRERGE
jgi:hypothetical protein